MQPMGRSALILCTFAGAALASPQLRGSNGTNLAASGGQCCYNGCQGCVDVCTTKEQCLSCQNSPDGGCDSSPRCGGDGAEPTWCVDGKPTLAALAVSANDPLTAEQASNKSSMEGKCCFDGCNPDSCVTEWCTTKEQCLAPQLPDGNGGCDSSGQGGSKPTWCPAGALTAAAPATEPASNKSSTKGKCCFDGCNPESCVTDWCTTKEQCLAPQLPDGNGGCDSSPPYGHGAKPTWCVDGKPTVAALAAVNAGSAKMAPTTEQGECCFDGCSSCVTDWCTTKEQCLAPQLPDGNGGCDSSPPYGHGAKPTWCVDGKPTVAALAAVYAGSANMAPATEQGKCCFDGCSSCVTDWCTTKEQCLAPQLPDGNGGCDSSPPYGHGAKPTWCVDGKPTVAALAAVDAGSTNDALTAGQASNASSMEGKCCFDGCNPDSCVTDWCTTEEQCLAPQLPDGNGGCDSSGQGGAKPTWCPAGALTAAAPATEQASNKSRTEGRCCFDGCNPDSCVTDWCTTKEQCLAPQLPDGKGGCDSSGQGGAKPTWCLAGAV